MPPNKGGSSSQNRNLLDTSKKRQNTTSFTPPSQIKNRFSPLQNIDDRTEQDATIINNTTQDAQVSLKTSPVYVHNIKYNKHFTIHYSIKHLMIFKITHTKNLLKFNLTTIDDYRIITKYFDESKIEYNTYQLYFKKQLSIIIRILLPISISEKMIFSVLTEKNLR